MTEHLRWSGRETQARRRVGLGWIVWGLVAASLGCAEPLAAARYSPVTGLIPASAPYALVGRATPGDAQGFDERISKRLAHYRDNLAVQHIVRVFGEVLGADLLDIGALRAAGLDPQGDFAVVGLGVWPAAIVKIADQEKLDVYLEGLRTRSKPTKATAGGVTVETLEVGAARLSLAQTQGYLVGVFHREELNGADILAQVLEGDPAKALGRSLFFDVVLASVGEAHGVLTVVNTRALDEALLAKVDLRADPLRPHLSPERLKTYDEERSHTMETCRDGGRFIADRVPYIALGSTLEDQRWRQQLMVRLDPQAEVALRKVMPGLKGSVAEVFQDALVAFAVGVDIEALARHADFPPALTLCPNLAMFTGAAGVLGRSLAETDASKVFGAALIGALYDFDLKPGFLTKRSGMLLFEAKQPQAALEGFELFLLGLGFSQIEGVTPGGSGRAYVVMGALAVSVIPFERHIALVLGEVAQKKVDSVTSPSAASASAVSGEVGRFELRGEPLQVMLRGLIDQLALLTPVNAEYGRALLEAVEGVRSVSVSGRFEPEAFMIQIDSQVQLEP
jgi:hypothetical protein